MSINQNNEYNNLIENPDKSINDKIQEIKRERVNIVNDTQLIKNRLNMLKNEEVKVNQKNKKI